MAIEVLALAGGVGGAKLALGLARILPPDKLAIVVNTGDDENFYGLHVSPDLDTVMYTLAGLSNTETGWGLAGDTFQDLEMLGRYEENAYLWRMMKVTGHEKTKLHELEGFNHGGMAAPAFGILLKVLKGR